MLNRHYGNPAALVFECPRCKAAPGVMCSGAVRPEAYRYTIHKSRERLLEMPRDLAEWQRRLSQVRGALGVPDDPSAEGR